jgi:glycosyltransferase involved in cell wall biosynthesis
MKILHVMPTYLPAVRYGGPMFAVHALCRNLAALGHEVQVCTTSIDGPGDLDMPLGVPVDLDGVKVWYFRADRLRSLAVSSGMRAHLRGQLAHVDLLHTHSVFLWPSWSAARSAREKSVPYVMAPRGMLVPELLKARNRFAKTLWLRLLEWPNLAGADALHFTSELERADAARLGIPVRRAAVIANGICLEETLLQGDSAADTMPGPIVDPFVLHLGRINWKKGLDRLLRALVQAPNIRAVIAGHDEEDCRASLEKLARECGVADRVRFLDPVYGAAKWRLLHSARALVLPSHSENFGNAVLEAMAAGKPVVVTPGVGLAAAVRDSGCGMVVDPDPGALARALEQLWRDEALCRLMGERGRALVESEYAWPRIAGQVVDLYRSILDARAAGAARN